MRALVQGLYHLIVALFHLFEKLLYLRLVGREDLRRVFLQMGLQEAEVAVERGLVGLVNGAAVFHDELVDPVGLFQGEGDEAQTFDGVLEVAQLAHERFHGAELGVDELVGEMDGLLVDLDVEVERRHRFRRGAHEVAEISHHLGLPLVFLDGVLQFGEEILYFRFVVVGRIVKVHFVVLDDRALEGDLAVIKRIQVFEDGRLVLALLEVVKDVLLGDDLGLVGRNVVRA